MPTQYFEINLGSFRLLNSIYFFFFFDDSGKQQEQIKLNNSKILSGKLVTLCYSIVRRLWIFQNCRRRDLDPLKLDISLIRIYGFSEMNRHKGRFIANQLSGTFPKHKQHRDRFRSNIEATF